MDEKKYPRREILTHFDLENEVKMKHFFKSSTPSNRYNNKNKVEINFHFYAFRIKSKF